MPNYTPQPEACKGCQKQFPSRNAVFKHLKETSGACLDPSAYQDFVTYVHRHSRDKVILLYGYLPGSSLIRSGQEAAEFLLTTLEEMIHGATDASGNTKIKDEWSRINRSYGSDARNTSIVDQDEGSAAVTEVVVARLPSLLDRSVDDWLVDVNQALETRIKAAMESLPQTNGVDGTFLTVPQIRIFGRQPMPLKKFNAEIDMTHRRVEYLLPADLLLPDDTPPDKRHAFLQSLPSFFDFSSSTEPSFWPRQTNVEVREAGVSFAKPSLELLDYLYDLKKKMQSLTTHIERIDQSDAGAVMEKKFNQKKRRHNRQKGSSGKKTKPPKEETESKSKSKVSTNPPTAAESNKGKNVLKRRRYHNFTPTVMAHEYLASRRLDRIYHRATLRFDPDTFQTQPITDRKHRPFFVLSLTGDILLRGQVERVIGLFVALARGLVSQEFIDLVFDEGYPHLVPTPPAPLFGWYACEAFYSSTEGRVKSVLNPRKTNHFESGWNDEALLTRIAHWQQAIRESHVAQWLKPGEINGRLVVEQEWTDSVLHPWAEKARQQLADYQLWKNAPTAVVDTKPDPHRSLSLTQTLNDTVPELFVKTLRYLREANDSGNWPTTTPKRQLVMVSSVNDDSGQGQHVDSLSAAHFKAKAQKTERTSAYKYMEGQGGASGSFSVGAMPGTKCTQPKSNELFPELMKAAFELEMALMPERTPSSTIAINRNAQFRPHTDSGAGAGQSSSLIVGLGTYSGGELVVEGDKHDIRYKAIEFNGWKQRHWTMPFEGERFSLVWFTPKGCEGVRGIDLCK